MLFSRSKQIAAILVPGLLVLLGLILAWQNYVPGTWLIGWDTLHPEFDFSLNLQRLLFGVWREDQGLGALAAHSHMSELPRVVILWLFSLILPVHALRYAFVAVCLVLGPLGVYVLLKREVLQGKNELLGELAAFLGGMFYLFNLGTLQHFYVVFEMFAVQYAALGWLFWLVIAYLRKGRRSTLVALFLVSLLASPMAYASTLWFAYFAGLSLFCLSWWWMEKSKKVVWLVGRVIGVTLVANAYWLLPNLYFILSGSSQVPSQSLINALFSVEAFLQNKAFGTMLNLIWLRNFLFNWQVFDFEAQNFVLLLDVWLKYLVWWSWIGLLGFILAMSGLVRGFIDKQKSVKALFLPALLAFFMLVNANFPFTPVYEWLREHIGIFEEGFRFPFTKFSLLLMLALAVWLAWGWGWILEKLQKRGTWRVLPVFLSVTVVGLLMMYGWPMFRGELISRKIQLKLPEAYVQLNVFMQEKPAQARVAQLPVQSLHGWEYRNWGFQGAGFTWFGVPQPVLVRDFDRWSGGNEGFYGEMSSALYGCEQVTSDKLQVTSYGDCSQDVGRVLDKYDVSYVLIDGSVVSPGNEAALMRFDESGAVLELLEWEKVFEEEIVSSSDGVLSVEDSLQNDQLEVWARHNDQLSMTNNHTKTNDQILNSRFQNPVSGFVWVPESYSWVEADTSKVRRDVVYEEVGNYVTLPHSDGILSSKTPQDDGGISGRWFPFAQVMREEISSDQWSVTDDVGNDQLSIINFQSNYNSQIPNPTLVIPGFEEGDVVVMRAKLHYLPEGIEVRFEQLGGIRVGGRVLALPSIPPAMISLDETGQSLWVRLGEKVARLDPGQTQQLELELGVGEPLALKLFAVEGQLLELPTVLDQLQLSQCWTRTGAQGQVMAEQIEGGMKLVVKDASGCLSYRLGSAAETALMQVAMQQRSADGLRPHFCVTVEGEAYECQHEDVYYQEQNSSDWSSVERFVEMRPGAAYWLDITARPSETVGKTASIDYQTPAVQVFPLLQQYDFGTGIWEGVKKGTQLKLADYDGSLQVELLAKPMRPDLQFTIDPEVNNCDVFKRGEVGKNNQLSNTNNQTITNNQITNEEQMTGAVEYWARDRGAACEGLAMPNLDVSQSYLIRMKGQNVSGRSMKFYLSNWVSQRADIEYLLDEGSFDQLFSVLPWDNLVGRGYSVNVETRSFGKEESVNRLEEVAFYQVPLSWLSRIRVIPGETLNSKSETLNNDQISNFKITNNLEISSVQKWGTSHYFVKVKCQNSNVKCEERLVALSQGYDAGWIAFQMSNSQFSIFKLAVPWFYGEKLHHVKVNGWANGWIVPATSEEGLATSEIVLVYWPQYLEWVGLAILPVVLGGLVISGWFGKKKRWDER